MKTFNLSLAGLLLLLSLGVGTAWAQDTERQLAITSVAYNGEDDIIVGADGNYTITLDVTLQNNGTAALTSGESDYTLSLLNNVQTALDTQPVASNLAAGASQTMSVTFTVDGTNAGRQLLYVRENVSGTISEDYVSVYVREYKPDVDLYQEQNGRYVMLFSGDHIDFGTSQEPVIREFVMANSGTAPFVLESLTVPEGFTVSMQAGDTLAADSETLLLVVLNPETPGTYEGDLILNGPSLENFKLHLKGTLKGQDYWYEDFENGLPGSMIAGKIWNVEQYSGSLAAVAYTYQGSAYEGEARYLISPRLEIKEGETLQFQAAKNSYYLPSLKVYFSTDRSNWQLIHEFSSDDFDRTTISPSGGACRFTDMSIDGVAAGTGYIMWEGFGVSLDNIYGYTLAPVTDDVMIAASEIPTNGEINSTLNASITLSNYGVDYSADEYTVEWLIDDVVVATAAADSLKAGQTTTYTMAYTPHTAGTFETMIRFMAGNYELDTELTELVITEEIVAGEVVVGDETSISIDSEVPFDGSSMYSVSELIYPASQINLAAGTKITRLTFKGRNTSQCLTDFEAWIENTTDSQVDNNALHPTDDMTLIHEGTVVIPKVGSAGMTPVHEPLVVIDFPQPFVYDGTNLRLRFHSTRGTSGNVKFQSDPNAGVGMFQSNYKDEFGYCRSVEEVPVLYLSVIIDSPHVTGTVTDATTGNAIEGATVTIASGEVMYTGTTDAQGNYDVEVKKDNLQGYEITVVAEGYESATQAVDLTERPVVIDFALTPAASAHVPGDVNGDGSLDGSDLNILINIVLGKDSADNYDGRANVDGQGGVDGSDINTEINLLLNK